MLVFNPKKIFALRGIRNPVGLLADNGINRSTASKLLSGQLEMVKSAYLEKICVLLNCTPSDLYEWHEGRGEQLPENHALRGLRKAGDSKSFSELVKDIPVEKLQDLETLLDDLRIK